MRAPRPRHARQLPRQADGQLQIPARALKGVERDRFRSLRKRPTVDSVSLLGPMDTMLDTPATLPAMLHLPGMRQGGQQTVVIRRFPCRRAFA